MKKIIIIALAVALLVPFTAMAADSSFTEMVAGSLKVSKQKVGVIQLTPLSYIYQMGSKVPPPARGPLSEAITMELIKKGAQVMELSPAGMEQIVAPFIAIRKGQFSTKEVVAASADKALANGLKNTKGDMTAGFDILAKLMEVNEITGEVGRLDNYESFYKKLISMWGVDRLITIQPGGTFSCLIKGYEIDGPSASLVFMYSVNGDKDNWPQSFPYKYNDKRDDQWQRDGITIVDPSGVKYESSTKRRVELVKRIAEYLK
jgi:hypothetical protein